MKTLLGFILLILTLPALAADSDSVGPSAMMAGLGDIQHQWARIQYQLPEEQREDAFENLAVKASELVAAYPDQPEPLIWQGIVLSTYAGAKGGLGALGLVKDARAALELALEINPQALDGSAYTSLGSLYYQVPGWPLSFGDDDQAEQYLKKALALNPQGIDPNFFFADYLIEKGDKARAKVYLEKALKAPPREGRLIADTGRRAEVEQRLNTL